MKDPRNNTPAYEYRQNSGSGWINERSYRISDAVKGGQWDYISLQQVSGLSGLPEYYGRWKKWFLVYRLWQTRIPNWCGI